MSAVLFFSPPKKPVGRMILKNILSKDSHRIQAPKENPNSIKLHTEMREAQNKGFE